MPVFLAPLALMFAIFREIFGLLKKPKYRALLIWTMLILLLGTVFYQRVEGWSWLDSLYFSVITLATVGYGDFAPTTDLAKMFTIGYIFIGLSVFVSFASMLANERAEIRERRLARRDAKKGGAGD